MQLFFDTETTGKPIQYNAPISAVNNWPRLVQLGFIVMDDKDTLLEQEFIVKPNGFTISEEVSAIHGITTERAIAEGNDIEVVVGTFTFWLKNCDVVIGHNISFDVAVFGAEYWRLFQKNPFEGKKLVCTMKDSTQFCGLPGPRGFKYPKLHELYFKLFNEDMGAAHTALQDIRNTVKCYFELVRIGVIK